MWRDGALQAEYSGHLKFGSCVVVWELDVRAHFGLAGHVSILGRTRLSFLTCERHRNSRSYPTPSQIPARSS